MISKKGHTTIGATKGYGLPKGFGSNHNTTLAFAVSKLIRTPLPLNTDWNCSVNKCNSEKELIDFVCDNGTVEMIINYSTINTNRIKFDMNVDNSTDMPITCFSSTLFKEILQANKDATSGKLEVSSAGLARVTFSDKDYSSTYYLVQLQTA